MTKYSFIHTWYSLIFPCNSVSDFDAYDKAVVSSAYMLLLQCVNTLGK